MEKLGWRVAAVTDRGCERAENQDNFYISPDNRVLVIADGMGGSAGGAQASRLAVEAIETLWLESKPHANDREEIQRWLVTAISSANLTVFNVASSDPRVQDMGTTIVAAVQSEDGKLQIGHVGDSRAYLVRGAETSVLTQDHSLVMDLLLKGMLTPEQFKNSPFKHYLTRCVGHNHKVQIDQTPVDLQSGDWIIMCTDGLTAVLHDEQIGEVVCSLKEPQKVCEELLRLTLEGGAPDNVTILAVQYQPSAVESQPEAAVDTKGEDKPVKKKKKKEVESVAAEEAKGDT